MDWTRGADQGVAYADTNSNTAASEPELEIDCGGCGTTLSVPAHLKTTTCPYCSSPSIVERPASHDRPDPTFVVGFVIDQEQAAAKVRRWIESRGLFARSDFKRAAVELTRGVYLPAYLYSATAHSGYAARIGENYTVTETYTSTDSKGNTTTHTRTRTETEWRNLRGHHSVYVLDVLVTASKGVSNQRLEAIEPYDLRALRRYTSSVIAGWIAEEPSRTRERCFEVARKEAIAKVGKELEDFMPGDSFRDLEYSTRLDDEVVDLVLLPVWSFAAKYDAKHKPVRVLVNGQTGEVAGRVPISSVKVTAAVLIGLGIVLTIIAIIAANQ